MNIIMILLCICGLALHFLMRWGESWRKERISPLAYAVQDLPGWIAAPIGALVCMLLLDSLPALLGIPGDFTGSNLMRAAAFAAGYMGSSIAAKVPALFTGKGAR